VKLGADEGYGGCFVCHTNQFKTVLKNVYQSLII